MSEVVAYRPLRAPTPPQIAIGLAVLGVFIGAPLAPLGGLLLAGFAYGLDGWVAAYERGFPVDETPRLLIADPDGVFPDIVAPTAPPTRTVRE